MIKPYGALICSAPTENEIQAVRYQFRDIIA